MNHERRASADGGLRQPLPPRLCEFGARALWNKRLIEAPTKEDALVVARALRIEGNRAARELAEQIERACHAVV